MSLVIFEHLLIKIYNSFRKIMHINNHVAELMHGHFFPQVFQYNWIFQITQSTLLVTNIPSHLPGVPWVKSTSHPL